MADQIFIIPLLKHPLVTSARNLAPRNSDGSSSDPYCILYYGDKKERTKHVQKTVNPIWNESFVFIVDGKSQALKIEVRAAHFSLDFLSLPNQGL